ncbi:MAG: transcriptional regulator [Azoarcus sp.]|nr:transcriptional regulator [Azoarcus sp.]
MSTRTVHRTDKITQAWGVLDKALGLAGPIRDEAHHARLAEFAESLADTLPDDAGEPLWGLVSLIGERVAEYEKRAHPLPELPPHELLRELMTEWGLNQSDLPEVGTQSIISEILSGKRALNLRQIKALAKRFAVPVEVFV